MAGVPAINMPYIAPAARIVDGLPSDPSAIQADHMQAGRLVPAMFPGVLDATAPAGKVKLMRFLKATCAIFPGEDEDTIQRLECPDYTRAEIKVTIARHRTNRFNTSENHNFNCFLKELITHHDFMVDQHNYALTSSTQWLLEPVGETEEQQFHRLEAANDFRTARYVALQRLDVLFETRKEEVRAFMEDDEATEEIWRLDMIHRKLKEEPEFLARSYNSAHEYPPPKLRFAEMDNETKYFGCMVSRSCA